MQSSFEHKPKQAALTKAAMPVLRKGGMIGCRIFQARIGGLEKDLMKWSRGNPMAKRLETIPGIGFITASALAASVTDPRQFTSGRQFAAWLGLTPRANSSGGKERLGHISKMGDRYLRRLLVNGMTSRLRWVRLRPDIHPWAARLLHRKPAKLVAVAMANKTARIAWAVMTRDETYRPQPINGRPSTGEAAA